MFSTRHQPGRLKSPNVLSMSSGQILMNRYIYIYIYIYTLIRKEYYIYTYIYIYCVLKIFLWCGYMVYIYIYIYIYIQVFGLKTRKLPHSHICKLLRGFRREPIYTHRTYLKKSVLSKLRGSIMNALALVLRPSPANYDYQ